jgi:hypothetical protein
MEAVDQQVAEANLGLNLSTTLPFNARRRVNMSATRFALPRTPGSKRRNGLLTSTVANMSNNTVSLGLTGGEKTADSLRQSTGKGTYARAGVCRVNNMVNSGYT